MQHNGAGADPVWVIGTVVSLPQNTWSDGYTAGLEVVDVVCTGTSAFWETNDPTEETQWECKSGCPNPPLCIRPQDALDCDSQNKVCSIVSTVCLRACVLSIPALKESLLTYEAPKG